MKNVQMYVSEETRARLLDIGDGKCGETPDDVLNRALDDLVKLRRQCRSLGKIRTG